MDLVVRTFVAIIDVLTTPIKPWRLAIILSLWDSCGLPAEAPAQEESPVQDTGAE